MDLKTLHTKWLALKAQKPLVLNLTNTVTMDFIANALLALGAAPMMSNSDQELEELIKIASSVYLNLGTLDAALIERCHQASALAQTYNKPLILDPVGSGASLIRTQTAKQLLPYVNIVRGNASEIIALTQTKSQTLGVEANHSTLMAKDSARILSQEYGCTVVVSGAIDFITDSQAEKNIPFGSPFMPLVTGMGCALTAVIAALSTVSDSRFECATLGTLYYALCGQQAQEITHKPGSFKTAFIDALYEPDFKLWEQWYAV